MDPKNFIREYDRLKKHVNYLLSQNANSSVPDAVSFTNAATVDIPIPTGSFSVCEIEFYDLIVGTNGTEFRLRTSADGVSFSSVGTDYSYSLDEGGSSPLTDGFDGEAFIKLTGSVGADPSNTKSGYIKLTIINPLDATRTTGIQWTGTLEGGFGLVHNLQGSGFRNSASAVSHIRLYTDNASKTISGKYKIISNR